MYTALSQRRYKMAYKIRAFWSILMISLVLAALVSTSEIGSSYPVSVVVYNSLTTQKNLTLTTEIAYRGILLGALRKLQKSKNCFKFTVVENPDYGPFLESVNGVAGNDTDHTYWELLVKLQNSTIIRPDVGVGCYIPKPYDTVVLKFTKW